MKVDEFLRLIKPDLNIWIYLNDIKDAYPIVCGVNAKSIYNDNKFYRRYKNYYISKIWTQPGKFKETETGIYIDMYKK